MTCGESLHDTMASWMTAQAAAGCSGNTIRQRHDIIRRLGEWTGDDPRHLTAEQIEAWLAKPRERPRRGARGEGLSAGAKAAYNRCLRAWYSWLVETDRIDRDPMRGVAKARPPRGVPRPVTTDEVRRLIAAADGDLRAWLLLAAYQGLRAHEIAKIRGEDIRGDVLDVLGKGGVHATVPLHPAIADLSEEYPRRGYWFPTDPSRRTAYPYIWPGTVSRLVGAHFRAHGVEGATHRLRHWTGTTTLQATGDLEVTRRVLRHASVATTQIYAQVADDTVRRAVEGLPRVS